MTRSLSAVRSRVTLALLVAITFAPLPGCETLPKSDSSSKAIQTQLYFGFEKPDKSYVTDADWQKFVDEQVTPRFPDGLTVLHGDGQYRGANGVIVHEPSRVITVLYSADDAKATDKKL